MSAIVFATFSISAATGWFNDFLTLRVNGVETANNYYLGADPATGAAAFQGAAFGTVTGLELSNFDMSYWSDTQDRTGGALYYKIMAADGITQVVAPSEIIWEQIKLTELNNYKGVKPATMIQNLNFLSGLPTGSYQLHLWAKSWGTGQGDSWLSNFGNNYVATFSVYRPVVVSGANGITDNTGYVTLKAAFDAINAQFNQTGRSIEIQITGNTNETDSAVLNQPAHGSWNSLTIYPTTTATISGSSVGAIIILNGADNVTINGRLNKTGAARSLTISHTSNADNRNQTIRLWNEAQNNTIQFCNVTGRCPSSLAGVIFFGDARVGGAGNNNNTIEFCDINAAGAANGIAFISNVNLTSTNNIIRGNNIYDFYISNSSATVTNGITVTTNYATTTITGNSLYQTQTRDYSTVTGAIHTGINLGAAMNGNVISDNYIGGSAPLCGGTPWTVSGGLYRLFAIQTSVGSSVASSVQGNTVANIDITSGFNTNGSSIFIGHQHAGGTINVGTITGNTIGSMTSAASIVVKCNVAAAAAGPLCVGMNVVAANATYSNNRIGGIVFDLMENGNRGHLYGVSSSGTGPFVFTNNHIGSATVPNSIEHKGSTYVNATFSNNVILRGLNFGNAGTTTLTGNTISNLTANSTTVHLIVNGIAHSGGGVNNISNNIVTGLKSASTRVITAQASDASLIGITIASNSAGNVIASNAVHNLETTNPTLATDVYGIHFHSLNAGSSTFEGNRIYNLKTASSNAAANVVGISITRGLTNTVNNMISLGHGITNPVTITGIRKFGTANTQNNNFYHNTVLIGGSDVAGTGTSSTAAFVRAFTATDDLKNNILVNNRSNATGNTQKHYVLNANNLTTFTSDFNVAHHPGVGGLLGVVGTTDYATGEAWSTATPTGTGLDLNSRVGFVNFTDAVNGDLTVTGFSIQDNLLRMPSLATVLNDALGTTRNTIFTYAGAHESLLPFLTTGNENPFVKAGIGITKTGIEIRVNETSNIALYSLNGALIDNAVVNSFYSRALSNGVYIVKINGKAVKVVK